ncbi:hypothetical protein [Nocardioides jishulii]|uniref:Uncharacterized protein n=1 Tax=Nocardioides jishulii TaxID=2575440 RepID=A0A4U2YRW2_9ACTN|nr:hypothetical protein [Nocardioides jishulii]QCX28940.1 hypothetical protein FCL41_16505 [Nocardioides jishulii]TKI64159.1 hypothetical protein FC770_03060 [Nocardioides jishulii]
MTTIHDQLHDEVTGVRPDLDSLAFSARRQGLAKRRLARSLTAVGTAAAVSLLAVGGWALTGLGGTSDPANVVAPAAEPTAPSTPPAPELVPITGRTTAWLLNDLVSTYTAPGGTADDFEGQGGGDLVDEAGNVVIPAERNSQTLGSLTLTNAVGRSEIGLNVQRLSAFGGPLGGDIGDDCSDPNYEGTDCEVTTLPNGDILRTYTDRSDKPGRTRLVAEVLSSSRDLRVVLSASVPTGTAQAITPAQMQAVVTDPVWAHEVTAEVAAAAEALDFINADDSFDAGMKMDAPPAD